MGRKISIILIILLVVLNMGVTVYASEFKNNQEGVIVIENSDTEEQKGEFLCDKIADLKDGSYVMKPEYTEPGIDLNHVSTTEELQQITERIDVKEKNTTIKLGADKEGKVQFENLEEGVYLIRQEGNQKKRMVPVLVAIPTWDEEKQMMKSKITIVPKYTEELPKEKKIIAKTGDSKDELIQVVFIFGLSSLAILSTKIILKILQKY